MAEKEGFELYAIFPYRFAHPRKAPIYKGFGHLSFILSLYFPMFSVLLGVKLGVVKGYIQSAILSLLPVLPLLPLTSITRNSTMLWLCV